MFRMVTRRIKKIVAWVLAVFAVVAMTVGVWWLATLL